MCQCAEAGLDWRSTSTAALREPGPIATKLAWCQADHCLGFHEDEHLGPSQPAPIRPTGPSWEPSEASWLKRVVFQLASPSMEPTGTTSKWRGRRSKASQLGDPNHAQ